MIREGFQRLFDRQAHDCEVMSEAGDGMETLTQVKASEILSGIRKPQTYQTALAEYAAAHDMKHLAGCTA